MVAGPPRDAATTGGALRITGRDERERSGRTLVGITSWTEKSLVDEPPGVPPVCRRLEVSDRRLARVRLYGRIGGAWQGKGPASAAVRLEYLYG
jgi:hypothetical protein